MAGGTQTTVGIIGAGVSGISASIHLRAAGLDVQVFERSAVPGGVWVHDSRTPPEPPYPADDPSISDFTALNDQRTWRNINGEFNEDSPEVWHAPPGPCYDQLSNNVPVQLLELRTNSWKPNTEPLVNHSVLAEYLQDTARRYAVEEVTLFDTRVDKAEKVDSQWQVHTTTLTKDERGTIITSTQAWKFDKLVVATGHYHACRVPDIPGLKTWKETWPSKIQHSKSYRSPKAFKKKTVLLVGASVSSTDIATELGEYANKTYQTSRSGIFDLPVSMLPANATRTADIAYFEAPHQSSQHRTAGEAKLGRVHLKDGTVLEDVDDVILCTGYHMSFPFFRQYHDDAVKSENADDRVIVTDGNQMHNLHKDIFYIPDPSLVFIGIPYHVATFSLFEFQTMAVAEVFAGNITLPTEEDMRSQYQLKTKQAGAGKAFHSLKPVNDANGNLRDLEIEYVSDLVDWVNQGRGQENKLEGHSKEWRAAKAHQVASHAVYRGTATLEQKFEQEAKVIQSKHLDTIETIVAH